MDMNSIKYMAFSDCPALTDSKDVRFRQQGLSSHTCIIVFNTAQRANLASGDKSAHSRCHAHFSCSSTLSLMESTAFLPSSSASSAPLFSSDSNSCIHGIIINPVMRGVIRNAVNKGQVQSDRPLRKHALAAVWKLLTLLPSSLPSSGSLLGPARNSTHN